jgi:glycosyltransferase involved in cell wall biosynthesis
MIIIDTGSSDKTVEIARRIWGTDRIFEWNNNFSDARNHSIQEARMDWILLMDGDDEFHKDDTQKFLDLVEHSEKDGHYFKTLSYAGSQAGNDIVTNLNLRLLRNTKKYRFAGAIHEQITCTKGPMDYRNFSSERNTDLSLMVI